MIGLGTIINTAAIIAAGLIGMLIGNKLSSRFKDIITVAMGLCVCCMSIAGTMSKMLVIENNEISSAGVYVLIFSVVLGAVTGELLKIDDRINAFGNWLKNKTGNKDDNGFIDGFVTASLTVCVGAMAIVGAMLDGISGDYSILLTKSVLDFIMIIVMTASFGKGCIFSAIPVAVIQGGVTLISVFAKNFMSDLAIHNLSMVGNALIICIGVNLMANGKFRIKVANLVPAVIFAVAAAYLPFFQL